MKFYRCKYKSNNMIHMSSRNDDFDGHKNIYILEFLKLSSMFVYLCSSSFPLVANASGIIILSVARCYAIGTGN